MTDCLPASLSPGSGVVRDCSGLAVSLLLSWVNREGLRRSTSATILSGCMKLTAKMATLKEWWVTTIVKFTFPETYCLPPPPLSLPLSLTLTLRILRSLWSVFVPTKGWICRFLESWTSTLPTVTYLLSRCENSSRLYIKYVAPFFFKVT